MVVKGNVTLRLVKSCVEAKQEFSANGTLFGGEKFDNQFGRLPQQYWQEIKSDSEAKDFYLIVSYQTPIAWFANGEWRVPNVNYTTTTSRHLSKTGIRINRIITNSKDKWIVVEKK